MSSQLTGSFATRTAFAAAVRKFWHALEDSRGSRIANTFSSEAERIVEKWQREGAAIANLEVLLNHADNAVQFAAAAELLKFGETQLSIPVLEKLTKVPTGLIAPSARLLLMRHNSSSYE